MAFEIDYVAYRHAQWGGDTNEVWMDFAPDDLSDATFEWVFAEEYGGAAIITLGNAAAGAQGLSAEYDGGMQHPATAAAIGGTRVIPQIDEATLEGLDDPTPTTADIVLKHTLYITPDGGSKTVDRYGLFTIRQGVPGA